MRFISNKFNEVITIYAFIVMPKEYHSASENTLVDARQCDEICVRMHS